MTTVTNDGLFAVANALGVQTLPLVLAVEPQHETREAWTAAQHAATAELMLSGVLDSGGEVDDDLAAALFTLANPDRELAMRLCANGAVTRVCLARRGLEHAVAIRRGDEYDVRPLWADDDPMVLARPLIGVLGHRTPADIASFSAPSRELCERLDAAQDSPDYTRIAADLGVEERAAIGFGMAMAQCRAFAEIVAYSHDAGITTPPSTAVAVYDTELGRIVAASRATADQQTWSTFAPGSDHRVAQSISTLIESLPGGRWMP